MNFLRQDSFAQENFQGSRALIRNFELKKSSIVCISKAWMTKVSELQIVDLNNYLPPLFCPGFKKKSV